MISFSRRTPPGAPDHLNQGTGADVYLNMKRFAIALAVAVVLPSAACSAGTPPAPGAAQTSPASAGRLTVDAWSADNARAEFRGTVRESAHYEEIRALREAPPGAPYPWEVSSSPAMIRDGAWTLSWDAGAAAPGAKWAVVLASLPVASCLPGYWCDPLGPLRQDGPSSQYVHAAVRLN
ncbi:hypothetical protein GCM10010517_62770 [Streptosporangium fragile]|uniref:Uncharacterized protein n=1 Tax=Streptosporangium fragile TaxID=46186 RepID=A0ABN3W609_9ACTN